MLLYYKDISAFLKMERWNRLFQGWENWRPLVKVQFENSLKTENGTDELNLPLLRKDKLINALAKNDQQAIHEIIVLDL